MYELNFNSGSSAEEQLQKTQQLPPPARDVDCGGRARAAMLGWVALAFWLRFAISLWVPEMEWLPDSHTHYGLQSYYGCVRACTLVCRYSLAAGNAEILWIAPEDWLFARLFWVADTFWLRRTVIGGCRRYRASAHLFIGLQVSYGCSQAIDGVHSFGGCRFAHSYWVTVHVWLFARFRWGACVSWLCSQSFHGMHGLDGLCRTSI